MSRYPVRAQALACGALIRANSVTCRVICASRDWRLGVRSPPVSLSFVIGPGVSYSGHTSILANLFPISRTIAYRVSLLTPANRANETLCRFGVEAARNALSIFEGAYPVPLSPEGGPGFPPGTEERCFNPSPTTLHSVRLPSLAPCNLCLTNQPGVNCTAPLIPLSTVGALLPPYCWPARLAPNFNASSTDSPNSTEQQRPSKARGYCPT